MTDILSFSNGNLMTNLDLANCKSEPQILYTMMKRESLISPAHPFTLIHTPYHLHKPLLLLVRENA